MGAGAVFVLVVVGLVALVLFLMFSGVGASLWKKQTEPVAPREDPDHPPTHKVLDEQGNRQTDDPRDG